jgi:hypothetical protein
MYLRETECNHLHWVYVAWNRDWLQTPVKGIMNFRAPYDVDNLLTNLKKDCAP